MDCCSLQELCEVSLIVWTCRTSLFVKDSFRAVSHCIVARLTSVKDLFQWQKNEELLKGKEGNV